MNHDSSIGTWTRAFTVRAFCLGLGPLPFFACSSATEPGVEVHFVSEASGFSAGESFSSVDGQDLRVTEVQWATVALELVPCATALGWLSEALVPNAYAHGASSPTRLAIPIIESASAPDAVLLGVLRPPARRYCGVRYVVGAADADAVGIERALEMKDRSILARGFDVASAEAAEFEVGSTDSFEVLVQTEFALSDAADRITIRIERDRTKWLEGIALDAATAMAGARLAENLRESIGIRVQ